MIFTKQLYGRLEMKQGIMQNFNSNSIVSLESLVERGIFNEVDIIYFNRLLDPGYSIKDNVSTEGIIKAKLYEIGSDYHDAFTEARGWFQGIETKRKYINGSCEDLLDWLKDKAADDSTLDLDMGTFKTWMKTSETFFWRYFFLLHNPTWSKIESDLKSGKITDLENIYDIDFKSRKDTATELDSITDIKGLMKVVETYQKRSDKFFELIIKRKVKIKSFPFQVILLGMADLRRTVKKIVNLA